MLATYVLKYTYPYAHAPVRSRIGEHSLAKNFKDHDHLCIAELGNNANCKEESNASLRTQQHPVCVHSPDVAYIRVCLADAAL